MSASATCTRVARLLAATLLGSVLAGCGRPTAATAPASASAPYDRARLELIDDLGKATRAGDFDLASRKIERLRDLDPSSLPLATLGNSVAEQVTILAVNRQLAAHDLDGAARDLEQRLGDITPTDRLHDAEARLATLVSIRNYLQLRPFATSRDAFAAIDLLPPRLAATTPPTVAARYLAWQQSEKAAAAAQRERELRLVRAALVAELDRTLIADSPRAGDIAARLAADAGADPVHRRWPDWIAGRITAADVIAVEDPFAQSLALALLARQSPADARAIALPPGATSLMGQRLQVLRDLQNGDGVTALLHLRRLHESLPAADLGNLRDALQQRLDTYHDRAWGPTAFHALQMLYDVQSVPTH